MTLKKRLFNIGSTVCAVLVGIDKSTAGNYLIFYLHLYSDRTDKNIRHYFLRLNEFSYGKAQIPHRCL